MDDVNHGFSSWLRSPGHKAWLAQEGNRLLAFAKASKMPQGFGNLDEQGRLPADAIAETMNTARMTHSFALAHINGIPGCAELVDHGVAALAGPLRDAAHGGWFARPLSTVPTPAKPPTSTPSSRSRPVQPLSRNGLGPRRCLSRPFR